MIGIVLVMFFDRGFNSNLFPLEQCYARYVSYWQICIELTFRKFVQMLFKIGSGWLWSCPNGHSLTIIAVCWRTRFVYVWSHFLSNETRYKISIIPMWTFTKWTYKYLTGAKFHTEFFFTWVIRFDSWLLPYTPSWASLVLTAAGNQWKWFSKWPGKWFCTWIH